MSEQIEANPGNSMIFSNKEKLRVVYLQIWANLKSVLLSLKKHSHKRQHI